MKTPTITRITIGPISRPTIALQSCRFVIWCVPMSCSCHAGADDRLVRGGGRYGGTLSNGAATGMFAGAGVDRGDRDGVVAAGGCTIGYSKSRVFCRLARIPEPLARVFVLAALVLVPLARMPEPLARMPDPLARVDGIGGGSVGTVGRWVIVGAAVPGFVTSS